MKIEAQHDILRTDGRKIATREGTPFWWADVVRGAVLEVGLGAGWLARKIHDNPNVSRHVIVERVPELAERFAPEGAEVVCGTFPGAELPFSRFDCVCLDIPGSREPELVAATLELLADQGAIFFRKG